MQTDLNADLRLFEFVLLRWRLMMHSLSSFDNTVFSLKTGAFSNCFLQNNCSKNQILTQISIARERLNILGFQFYSFIPKVSEVYSKLTAPLRFAPEGENKYYYQPEQTNNY